MPKAIPSLAKYQTRINQAVDFINRHLDAPLRLEDVAAAACFSPFHFHRIFKSLLGETVNDFIIRQRCEWAVGLLHGSPHQTITEVAFQCGYSSSANLAKSLKKQYGLTASQIRNGALPQKSKIGKTNRKIGNAVGRFSAYAAPQNPGPGFQASSRKEKNMQLDIRQFPQTRVAYVRSQTGYSHTIIGKSWEKLMRWAGPRDLLGPQTLHFGISWDDPDVTPPHKCRYDAAISIPDDYTVTGEINTQVIPAMKCAVYRFEGKTDGLKETYERIYSEWLPRSGYQPGDFPPLEMCVQGPDDNVKKHYVFDIHIPVKPV